MPRGGPSPIGGVTATLYPFNFTTDGNTITITGYNGLASSIPSAIGSLPVTSIGGSAFSGCTSLTSVTIPASVTSIGNQAFFGCANLVSAQFAGNAPTMGTGAFDATASGFTVTYSSGATGFSSPTWDGYPSSEVIGLPIVSAPTTAGITANMATLGGNVTNNGGATVTALGVVFAPSAINANPQIGATGVTNVTGTGTGGVFTLNVSGLMPYTAYSFAAYATNSAGTGYSVTGTFTTAATYPSVTTPTSASITTTTPTLGGDVTSNNGATVTTLGVVYSPTATNPNPQIGGTGVTNVTGTGTSGVFTVNVSGLLPGTSYTFAAYATNSLGTSYSATGYLQYADAIHLHLRW